MLQIVKKIRNYVCQIDGLDKMSILIKVLHVMEQIGNLNFIQCNILYFALFAKSTYLVKQKN